MPRAGQIRIPITRRTAAAVSAWLLDVYEPPAPGVMAGTDVNSQERQRRRARLLGGDLRKKAARRRAEEHFTCLVDRELASWFGAMGDAVAITGGSLVAGNEKGYLVVPSEVWRAMDAFRVAAKARRGRKTLRLDELEARERGSFAVEERHRIRIARRADWTRRVDEWHRRGNTIAGAREPYPEKVT